MSEMVERIAGDDAVVEALWAFRENPSAQNRLAVARAALGAMRDPTLEMLGSARRELKTSDPFDPMIDPARAGRYFARLVAIAAALK
jgi:hypothetical protein